MKKKNIIKKNEDFNRMIQKIKPYKYKDYLLYLEYNNNDDYHFGFSVGKKIGTSVVRNKIRRQLKSIVDKNSYSNGFNCIIMVGKGIKFREFQEMKNNLNTALYHLNLVKGDKNEKKDY